MFDKLAGGCQCVLQRVVFERANVFVGCCWVWLSLLECAVSLTGQQIVNSVEWMSKQQVDYFMGKEFSDIWMLLWLTDRLDMTCHAMIPTQPCRMLSPCCIGKWIAWLGDVMVHGVL